MRFADMHAWLQGQLGPVGTVLPLGSKTDLENNCRAPGGVCVVALVSSDDARAQQHLDVVRAVAARAFVSTDPNTLGSRAPRLERLPVRFLVAHADAQPDLVKAVKAVDAPAVVALNPRTLRFAVHRGAFDKDSIHRFALDAASGVAELDKLREVPDIREDAALNTLLGLGAPKKAKKTKKGKKAGSKKQKESKDTADL
jgi:hypothetical protein